MCVNMDSVIIFSRPIPTSNGIIKPHIGHDRWLDHKEAFSEDIWKDFKIQSPPPVPTTALSAPPPPLPPPPISVQAPLPPLIPVQGLNHGEILNLKNSLLTKERQGVPTSNTMSPSGYGEDKTQLAAPDLESAGTLLKLDYIVEHGKVGIMEYGVDTVINGTTTQSGPLFYPDRMDEIWHGEFSKVFAPYLPHIWYLSPTDMCPSPRWRRFKDSAKVRFCCQTCGHGWTSMKGRVVFWYFLHLPFCEGYVQFKLYGQQCLRCNNGIYEPAMWYPEEVNKVLCNLYNRIGQTYYGFVKPPIRYDRRAGKPRTQHNASLCQACRDGECDSRPRTGPAGTPGPPHGVLTPTPTKIPPPTVSTRT